MAAWFLVSTSVRSSSNLSINDITIVTRKNQVLHIVADQWDEQGVSAAVGMKNAN